MKSNGIKLNEKNLYLTPETSSVIQIFSSLVKQSKKAQATMLVLVITDWTKQNNGLVLGVEKRTNHSFLISIFLLL